jgi:hypothetical protein
MCSPSSIVTIFAAILLCANISQAAVAILKDVRDPDDSHSCIDPWTGLSHRVGRTWQHSVGCGLVECNQWDDRQYIYIYRCGAVDVQQDQTCHFVTNTSLPYPGCCPQVVCQQQPAIETNLINTDSIVVEYEDDLSESEAEEDGPSPWSLLGV